MQKITSYLKLSTSSFLEFFVLKMISRRSRSIQEIYDELRSIGFRTPKGSLYPLLSSFRKRGLVESGFEEFDDGTVQKSYCLTDSGRQHLLELKRDWKHLNSTVISL